MSHSLPHALSQEEMDRYRGYWWSPDATKIAFIEVRTRYGRARCFLSLSDCVLPLIHSTSVYMISFTAIVSVGLFILFDTRPITRMCMLEQPSVAVVQLN